MCGITGIFDTRGARPVARGVLQRMNESQWHRGPDEGGLHLEPGVGLGHRRLSIIDLSTGQQPLFNEDGSVVVVFNGEIYNYQQLIPELQALGHVFRTRSDTEVIVHAWEAWGEACVERFRGMFAFALWDRNRQTFFMARDRLAVKPMHYASARRRHAAVRLGAEVAARPRRPASRPRSAGGRGVLRARLRGRAAHDLPPGQEAAARAHARHPPRRAGGRAAACTGTCASRVDAGIGFEDACAELDERLAESVRLRMIADVPLGAFLSGGVDSSAVVAQMARLSDAPVNTCSIGFDDPAFNESAFAQQVADRYRTRHFLETVESDDFDLVDTLARLYDEPYADSSAIPTYRVCQLARKHVTVALSGDGGDETFGGYRRYRLHLMEERMRAALPQALRQPLFGTLGRLYPKADWAPRVLRAKTTFEGMARNSVEAYFHSVSILRDPMRRELFSDALRARARRLQRARGVRPPRRALRQRRSARADPVPRPEDLPGRRHQHQGRPREHGAFARGARAADGPRARRMDGHAAVVASRSAARRARSCSRRRWSRACRTTCCTGRRWASRCRWRAGSAAR